MENHISDLICVLVANKLLELITAGTNMYIHSSFKYDDNLLFYICTHTHTHMHEIDVERLFIVFNDKCTVRFTKEIEVHSKLNFLVIVIY